MLYSARWKNSALAVVLMFVCFVYANLLFALHPTNAQALPERVTAAVPADFPPLYHTDERGRPYGFAIDVLQEVTGHLGVQVDYLTVTNWAEAMDAVAEGRADFIPGIGINPLRSRLFRLTSPFITLPVSCFVRQDEHGITSTADLDNKRVGVLDRSVAQNKLGPRRLVLLTPYQTVEECLFGLLSGHVDAVVLPESTFLLKARAIGVDDRLKIAGPPLIELRRGYLFPRNNPELANDFEGALVSFIKTSRFNEIYIKWWGKPKPYWTTIKLTVAGLVLFSLTIILFTFWRWRSVSSLNKELRRTMAEQAQTQEQLAASEARLNRAQEITKLGSFERNVPSGEGYWSDQLFTLFGLPIEPTAPSVDEFKSQIHPEDIAEYMTALEAASPTNTHITIEFRVLPKGTDQYRSMRGIYFFKFSESGILLKRFGAVQDITEIKASEVELRRAMERAEAANESKSQFLANMSHELRTPLNGAMGMLQLLQRDDLTSDQLEMVNISLNSCRNLSHLINDILDLSKVEAGKLDLKLAPFKPAEILHSLRETFDVLAREKDIEFSQHIADDVPEVLLGDPIRLRQLLFNLVGNAFKFTEKGMVRVDISVVGRNAPNAWRLLFSITDTGIGVPDAMIERIFDPFVQVDGAFTRKFQGTGLGLDIVKRLATLMDGHVAMESQEGEGTSVHFMAPFVETVEEEAPLFKEEKPVDPVDPKHILIAEDERVNRLALERFTRRLGHTCKSVTNGREAMVLNDEEKFDLILMDIQMPIMSGLDATRHIRKSEEMTSKPPIPIIALTAHTMSGDRETFLESGMNGYLAKPVSFEELEALINTIPI